METEAQETIEQWLAKVPEGPPSPPSQPNGEGLNITEFERNGGPALEPTDNGPAIRLPKINKRPRDESAESGQRVLQQIAGNQYQRKPRRKTRDDKYEYKRPSSPRNRQSRAHKDKGKRTRTSRKHTMNDAFHATNVAQERLTLRNTMNMGIFSKGKASSPIKLRDGHDLSFSESQFLAQKNGVAPGTGTGTVMDLRLDKSPRDKEQRLRPKASHYVFRELTKGVVTQTPAVSYAGKSARSNQEDQSHSCKSKDVILSPQFAGSGAKGSSNKVRGKFQDVRSPSFVERTSSATPYSWSVSDRRGSQQSREVEDRLLRVLHIGLSPQKSDNHNDSAQSNTQYYSTDDLRSLLETRKLYWQAETRHGHDCPSGGATRNETHGSIAIQASRPAQRPASVAMSQSDMSEAFSTSGNRAGHQRTSPKKVFDFPQKHFQGQEGAFKEHVALSPQRNSSAHHESMSANLDVEDDDIFFKNLDAAFGAIFKPEAEPSTPVPITRNKSPRLIAYKPIDGASVASHILHNKCQSPADPVDALFCDQPGLETLRTTGIDHCHDPDNELSVLTHGSLADSKHRNLPSTGEILDLPKLQTSAPFSMTAHDLCKPSIPPGFWRQNRLY